MTSIGDVLGFTARVASTPFNDVSAGGSAESGPEFGGVDDGGGVEALGLIFGKGGSDPFNTEINGETGVEAGEEDHDDEELRSCGSTSVVVGSVFTES